ncbi:MAG: hypothetical protein KAK00_09415 [Nanoarchaeota archaeon]|nr:hypothetical protein [Nanoarchaeota archaeon]
MQLKDKLSQLEKNDIFLEWNKKNKDSYLAHIFRMFDEANENIWQFGYYNADDTITTFIMDNDKVNEVPEEEIFKKDKRKLLRLNIKKIRIEFDEVLEKAKALQQKKYSQHPIMKKIVILQKIKQEQIFNITFVTKTFGTLNIHIDSETGEIKSDKFTSLMEIAKFEKGKTNKKDTSYIG